MFDLVFTFFFGDGGVVILTLEEAATSASVCIVLTVIVGELGVCCFLFTIFSSFFSFFLNISKQLHMIKNITKKQMLQFKVRIPN